MPAQSQQQQKLFGLALAFKRGEIPASEVSDEIKDIADRMSEKEIEDFAATKHKGLPKMKEQLRKIVREIMRERAISEIEISKDDMEKLHSDGEVEVDGEKVTFEEGKKRFRQQDGIGKAKYTISYHDGKQKHKDGSDFFGIQIFKNKKDLETFRNALLKKGYIEESVNEGVEPQIKKIAYFTGTRPEAVEDFVSKHALNITKLLKYVQKGGLPQRMELVSALAGRPNNPVQKKIIKMFNESVVNEAMVKIEVDMFKQFNQRRPDKTMPMKVDSKTPLSKLLNHTTFKSIKQKYDYIELHYGDKFLGSAMAGTDNWAFKKGRGLKDTSFRESINEGYSTEEKRIVMMAVRKLSKYRNVPIDQSINDLLGAGKELERDIKTGKIKK